MFDAEFAMSLVFGGIIIVVFAWNQFERPSYQPSRELARLIELLTPSDMVRRRVHLRAYAFYAGLLLLIYLVICVFATVPVLEAFGIAAALGGGGGDLVAQSPAVPLTVSLAMVGLAPSIRILQELEGKIRFAAHRLSGIPTRLLLGGDTLRKRPLGLEPGAGGHLIPQDDWSRLGHYGRHAASTLRDPDDFAEDMAKILAYRAWFIEGKLAQSAVALRPGIARNEAELAVQIDRLLLGLDALSGFDGGAEPAPGASRQAWEGFAREADQLCAEVCLMMMLNVEHGRVMAPDASEAAEDEAARATAVLAGFLRGIGQSADEELIVGMLWARATLAAIAAAFAWGALFGNLETGTTLLFPVAGGAVALSAFLTYSLAILVALSLYQHRRREWPSMFATDWVRWIGPAGTVFLYAAVAALTCVLVYNLYWSIGKYGIDAVVGNFRRAAQAAVFLEGPRTLTGPLLALGVIASVDAWRGTPALRRRRFRLALAATVAAMALWAAVARGLATQVAEIYAGEAATPLLRLFLDDWAMALAGARAALIGLVVIHVCQRTLARGLAGESAADDPTGAPVPAE